MPRRHISTRVAHPGPDIAEASAKWGRHQALGTGSVLPVQGGVATGTPFSNDALPILG